MFVTLPFVVRAVQPVLAEMDREMEDAAQALAVIVGLRTTQDQNEFGPDMQMFRHARARHVTQQRSHRFVFTAGIQPANLDTIAQRLPRQPGRHAHRKRAQPTCNHSAAWLNHRPAPAP